MDILLAGLILLGTLGAFVVLAWLAYKYSE